MPDETASVPSSGHEETPSAANAGSAFLVQGEARDSSRVARKPLTEGSPLASLPMQLDVTVPIPGFRVQHLLALEKGAVLESRWAHADDVPVWCGGAQLVWTEFEVVDQKLAVRVTRLA
jgi:flagellar motor switch/type III secretory pathway protein FliN